MATIDTVEVTVRVRMNVLAGGAYDDPFPLAKQGEDGLWYGPDADEIARAELPGLVLVPRKLGFWRRLFFNSSHTSFTPEVIEVIETKVVRSAYASGE